MGKSEERNGTTAHADDTTFMSKTSSEASKMLEAALLQMDDIISGTCTESNSDANVEWKDTVMEATRNLVMAIKSAPNRPSSPDSTTVEILLQWMQPDEFEQLNIQKENSLLGEIWKKSVLHQMREKIRAFDLGSDSLETAVSYKFWDDRWTPSEGYDSSGTSNSEREEEKYTNIDFFAEQVSLESNGCICQECLRKMESERGALRMEVSVLSEQVDAQSSKIQELENILRQKKDSLRQMEEALQKEVLLRSSLETQKLELLSSLSEMKLRQASLEHENLMLRSTSPISNGERFSRHTGQYSSLPRPSTSSKKGVAFAEEEKTIIIGDSNQREEEIPSKPLAQLSMEEVGDWLANLGLECYAGELRRWGATGVKLLDLTQQQLEKELEIKNALHRKKLLYVIECERLDGVGFLGSSKMDNAAVLRWLDDIGLPQHKDAFQSGKVDGRVLHRLTTEDLLSLGVTAQLHAASLRRGIQVLRELNFEFDNLERRSVNGNGADGSNVRLWTNHRVMEWLRVVDLAEYAPNMRGSGVHGGLMIYEGRFTSELLATLLSISPGKTLLRRHLTTHFNQILGREVVQRKREIESTLGFVPLTLTARLKVPKKSQFTLKRKKSKNEADYGNLVCPLEASPPGTPSTSTPSSPNLNSPTF